MSQEVFTEPWVRRWAEELKASADYRQAAAKWEGSLVIEMAADRGLGIAEDRGAFLDLWHGECRAARIAGSGDRDGADYVIRAGAGTWKRILDGELEPLLGLMSGQLELTRGSLLRLTPHAKASRELVRAATRVESHFPRRAVAYLKSDEARHLAYGVYLLTRLVAEHGDGVWRRIEARMGKLLPMAIDLIHEMFDAYDEMPFGLKVEEFTEFAMSQFRRRLDRVEKARRQSLEEVTRIPISETEALPA